MSEAKPHRWEHVKTLLVRLDNPVSNPEAYERQLGPEYLQWRKLISEQMPFLCFWQAFGELDGKFYFGNGFAQAQAMNNMAAAAGVFMSGPWPEDYFIDARLMERLSMSDHTKSIANDLRGGSTNV